MLLLWLMTYMILWRVMICWVIFLIIIAYSPTTLNIIIVIVHPIILIKQLIQLSKMLTTIRLINWVRMINPHIINRLTRIRLTYDSLFYAHIFSKLFIYLLRELNIFT